MYVLVFYLSLFVLLVLTMAPVLLFAGLLLQDTSNMPLLLSLRLFVLYLVPLPPSPSPSPSARYLDLRLVVPQVLRPRPTSDACQCFSVMSAGVLRNKPHSPGLWGLRHAEMLHCPCQHFKVSRWVRSWWLR